MGDAVKYKIPILKGDYNLLRKMSCMQTILYISSRSLQLYPYDYLLLQLHMWRRGHIQSRHEKVKTK